MKVYSKECLKCGKTFVKKKSCMPITFKKQKYCSITCTNLDKIGYKHKPESKLKVRLAKLGKKRIGFTPWNKGTKGIVHTKETKEKLRKIMIGRIAKEKNPNWKGGISKVNLMVRKSTEYKMWREQVFERDNYTCVHCGVRNGNGKNIVLHADHIKQFAFYPELRFELSNGRTLCRECHIKTPTYKSKYKI